MMNWAQWARGKYPALQWLHHIPNGGQRSKATAARLKAAGVKSGVPDLCLPYPCGGYHGLYIELKVGKNKPTANQNAWLDYLDGAGYCVRVCWGADEAIGEITKYLERGRKNGKKQGDARDGGRGGT